MPTYAKRMKQFGKSIFAEINELAQEHNALNLSQGRPDFDGQPDAVAAHIEALQSAKHNQYAPAPGTPTLRQAVAAHSKRFYDIDLTPKTDVIVTAGGTEAIFVCVMALVDPGDEVIVIEPYFDTYVPNIIMAGGVPVCVPLHPPDWTFDFEELRAAITPKTRAIMLNTPHNPTGRVFTREELQCIADLCLEHDLCVISDEVYEHLTFDPAQHIPIATLPGMFERTLTASSIGKSFTVTGWKIGWVFGATELMTGVARAQEYVTFAVNHPAQIASAFALNLPNSYFSDYRASYLKKRDLLLSALDGTGLKVTQPEGTYFIMADFSEVFDGIDTEFVRYLIKELNIACIPPTPFYSQEHVHIGQKHVRFAFCKTDETLHEAANRFAKWKK